MNLHGVPRGGSQAALGRGDGARPPVADPPAHSRPRRTRDLQPLALRGRARGAGARPGPEGRVVRALRPDQRLRARADQPRDRRSQVLPPHLAAGAAQALPGPTGAAGQAVEDQRVRLRRAAVPGRVQAGIRGGAVPVLHRARAVVRDPGRQNVVPEPGHRAHRRRAAAGARPGLPGAHRGPGPHPPRVPRRRGPPRPWTGGMRPVWRRRGAARKDPEVR